MKNSSTFRFNINRASCILVSLQTHGPNSPSTAILSRRLPAAQSKSHKAMLNQIGISYEEYLPMFDISIERMVLCLKALGLNTEKRVT
jgi:hypothetical protein